MNAFKDIPIRGYVVEACKARGCGAGAGYYITKIPLVEFGAITDAVFFTDFNEAKRYAYGWQLGRVLDATSRNGVITLNQ